MIPTKKQWKKWSLPSKYTAIGTTLAILSTLIWLVSVLYKPTELTATKYAKYTEWYLNAKLTVENMPDEFKNVIRNNPFLISDYKSHIKNTFGAKSNEFKIAASINDADSLLEAALYISKEKLEISDMSLKFTSGTDIEEMHKYSAQNIFECTSSSFEFKNSTGEIVRVTKNNGIYFKVPPQTFTEHSGCKTSKVKVNYPPATAILEEETLVIKHPKGLRFYTEENGNKVVKRKDIKYYYTLTPPPYNE